ncbi:MAG: maiA [Polaromonas sp.]|jgi:maleylacetoacetate isomerase|nr:maiA [Polaromonas sp.]
MVAAPMGCASRESDSGALGLSSKSMKLHNYFRSSSSFRVRIALELKGLPYEYIAVHIAKGMHKQPPYSALSADTLVPLLEVDGQRLSQSMAIIEYLDERHPEPPLLPADALGKARVRALSQSIACEIHPINNLRILKYLTGVLKVDETAKNEWYRHWCREGLQAFERQLEGLRAEQQAGQAHQPGQPAAPAFCYGDTPTLADLCLVPQIFNAQRFDVSFAGLPRTMAAFEACMALPAFQKAQPSACPDAEG